MGKKLKVRLTEQELVNFLSQALLGNDSLSKGLNPLSAITDLLKIDNSSETKSGDSSVASKSAGDFPFLDLNTSEGYNAYKEIADKFIQSRPSNLLGVSGGMLADAAKNTLNQNKKYVPAELALAQMAAEGGFSSNANARPIRTKNPFNVGNVDTGKNVYHSSVQNGIQSYYDLIAKNYLSGNKTASDLLKNFVNSSGQRYATGKEYENLVSKLASQAKSMSEPIYASLAKKKGSDIA